MELAPAPLASRARDRHLETAAPSTDGVDLPRITVLPVANLLSAPADLRPLRPMLLLPRRPPLPQPPPRSRLTDHAVVPLASPARSRRSETAALSMDGAAPRAATAELDATSRSVPARKMTASMVKVERVV
ncbi:hypothetical protein PMIN06_007026 [Paraphaeosphaeria minitans]